MSFRGRGGGGRGRPGGRGGFGGGGGRNFNRNFDQGPPERVIPLGYFDYTCQDDLICKVEIEDVPFFNAPIYLENKEQIGKIDEIFGNLRDYFVSIRLGENMKASGFKKNQKVKFNFRFVYSNLNVSVAAFHRSSKIVTTSEVSTESTWICAEEERRRWWRRSRWFQ